jgi:hypothetical protein
MVSTTFDMTQAIMAHIELMPGFPNEIAYQIISELSFLDLFRCQRVLKTWKDFIENDRTISEIMFRFPREIREDPNTAARTDHIEELWKEPYNRQNNGKGNLWDAVRVNPYLELRNPLRESRKYGNSLDVDIVRRKALENWEHKLQNPDPQESWRFMMLTCLPVTRAHLVIHWSEGETGLTSKTVIFDSEGITLVNVLCGVFKWPDGLHPRGYCEYAGLQLWPRWALWEDEHGRPAKPKHGETDDETLIGVNCESKSRYAH